MEDHALAHAQQVDPLLAVILAVIDPLDRETIAERFDRIVEGDAMVAPVGGSLGITPSKFVVLHNVLVISSRFKNRGLARCRAGLKGERYERGINEQRTFFGRTSPARGSPPARRLRWAGIL